MPAVAIPFPADPSFAEAMTCVVALQQKTRSAGYQPYDGHEAEPCALEPKAPSDVAALGRPIARRVYTLSLLRWTPLKTDDRLELRAADDPDGPPPDAPPRYFGVMARPTTAGGLPLWQTEVQEVEG
jgi:hypothetical protein